jgi:hypothetical protein
VLLMARRVSHAYPLEDASLAIGRLATRQATGKLVLVMP